ncbi:hypothetical protein IAR55_005582 [Kwoniella newhampshirensis]|uniref:Uncharacterized protein n=1 Tax=Kwoniella newhampshirensis TaxID=1651941 RepID=A0AAW0YU13_9TREE
MVGSSTALSPSNSQSSTLFRLVDLSSRTLRQCAPSRGHPASRYAEFLAGLANIIAAGTILTQSGQAQTQDVLDGQLWDQDWLNLWQSSGLEQDWLFGQIEDTQNGS